MKQYFKYIFFTLFLSFLSSFNAIDPMLTRLSGFLDLTQLINTLTGSQFQISSGTIGTQGQNITQSGNQLLTESVTYSGTGSAIVINTSSVQIDLNSHTISSSGKGEGIHGITIAPGTRNVTIKNGILSGFKGDAIHAVGTIGSGGSINNLKIENMLFVDNSNGVVCTYIENGIIENCKAYNSNSSTANAHGIFISNSANITVKKTDSLKTNATGLYEAYGIKATTSSAIHIVQCQASFSQGATAAGIFLEQATQSNYILECTTNNNIAITNNAYGIFLNNAARCHVEGCSSHANTAMTVGMLSFGIRLFASGDNLVKQNHINKNSYGVYDDEPAGIHTNIFSQNTAFQNTIADYLRPNSSPISFIIVREELLQGALAAGTLDNISVRI